MLKTVLLEEEGSPNLFATTMQVLLVWITAKVKVANFWAVWSEGQLPV